MYKLYVIVSCVWWLLELHWPPYHHCAGAGAAVKLRNSNDMTSCFSEFLQK